MARYILLLSVLTTIAGVCSAHPARSGAPQSLRVYGGGFYGGARTNVVVADKQTQDPLIGATVTIANRTDTLRGTTSKVNFYRVSAVYQCDRIFRDSVDLEVTYVGYKPFRKRYGPADFRGRIEVGMEIDEQSIAQVVVVGKQIAMVFKGDTTVYNAAAFKTLADDRFGELLRQLPGVEIKDNRIYADGEQVKRVLIDGRNLFGDKTKYAITDLEASDVKNVRIYEELSPEARRMGDTTAEKEKVMDVETKSKRGIIQGGTLEAALGASFERDYSGKREIRHSEAGSYYRNSEKGNLRFDASNSKDDGQKENASFSSKITPSKQTGARAEYTFRRGDSTSIFTAAYFDRGRQSSVQDSRTEYFPTEAYAVRTEENSNLSLSKSLSGGITNMTSIQRKKNSFSAFTEMRIEDGTASGRSRTIQRIDDEQTRTNLDNDSESRNINLNLNIGYYLTLSERSMLSLRVSGIYGSRNQDGWRIDTTASTPGLRLLLRDGGNGRQYDFVAGAGYSYKLGRKGRLTASYEFNREYDRSKQLAVDFLDQPQGVLDAINSYDYTTDTYKHNLQLGVTYNNDEFRFSGFVSGSIHRIARSERFPEQARYPRTFYQLNPMINLSAGKSKRRFTLNISSFPQVLSSESLRSTLDATNPLALRAGNPDLKLPNNLAASAGISFKNAKKALDFRIRIYGGYTFNYIATRRTLFLEQTYLPRYDYTAQKGAQLTTQTNVGGCYNAGGAVGYSQQIAALRSTVNANIGYDFRQSPYYLGEELFHSVSHSLRIGAGFNSGFSTKVKIGIFSSTVMGSNTAQKTHTQHLTQRLSSSVDLRFGKYFGSLGTLYEFYCNSRSKELTRHNVIFNAAAGRKFGKEDRLGLSVGVIDILNRPDYVSTHFETDYIVTSSTSYLGRYGYLRLAYTF